MTRHVAKRTLFVKSPKHTSLGGKRIETFFEKQLACDVVRVPGRSDIVKLNLDNNILPSMKIGETLILRGYPKWSDPKPSRILAQNFSHFFPWVGWNLHSLRHLILSLHWLLFCWRARGIVFQTFAGKERALSSRLGRLLCRLYRPEISVERIYIHKPLTLVRPATIDMFIFTSALPNKSPALAVALARSLVARKPGARVAVTLPAPADTNSDSDRGVRYLGIIPETEIRTLIASSASVVIPSKVESFSLPLHDCITAGVPVVCFEGARPDIESPILSVVGYGDLEAVLDAVEAQLD